MLSDEIKNDLEKLKSEKEFSIIRFEKVKDLRIALFIKNKKFFVMVGIAANDFIKEEICLKFAYCRYKEASLTFNQIYAYLKEEN